MAEIIAMGGKSFNLNNSDGLNNSNHIISLRPKNNLKKTAKNISVVTKVCPKKHRILNNLSILSHKKYNWKPDKIFS